MNVGRNIISFAVTTVTTVFISKVLLASDYNICSVRSILTDTLVYFFVKAHTRWKIPNCFLSSAANSFRFFVSIRLTK